MDLGLFSISLAVDDLAASRAFMVNGTTVVGLFEGMFEKNILTFNPGLALDGKEGKQLEEFTDVREVQAALRERGIELIETADEDSGGAAHITFEDPDGNPILIDQFF